MPDHVKPASQNGVVWVVGAGGMARAYTDVLAALGVLPVVIGRSAARAARLAEETGIAVVSGGLERFLAAGQALPRAAIVATSIPELAPCTELLLDAGVRSILVEKPAALTVADVAALSRRATAVKARVAVAYNRRFYASTRRARELIVGDGGPTSLHFDFTEWSEVIAKLDRPAAVKERFVLANSSHVLDLAFFLAGSPRRLVSEVAGSLPWHPDAAVYAGSGVTEEGALFSYIADWTAPGRWGVEVRTPERRLVLQPLEELKEQRHGRLVLEPVGIDDELDRRFKPGVYEQVRTFLEEPEHPGLRGLAAHARFCEDVVSLVWHGSAGVEARGGTGTDRSGA